jgi:hypothetical protein
VSFEGVGRTAIERLKIRIDPRVQNALFLGSSLLFGRRRFGVVV